MAAKREIAVGLNLRKINSRDFDYQKFDRLIEEAYLKRNRGVSHKRKRSFAPSSIGYGSGTCFAGETEFVTDEGIRTMADAVGEEVVVWTGHGRWGQGRDKSWSTARGWKPATVQSFGEQSLMKVTLSRAGVTKEIYATAEHRWIAETAKFPTVANRATPKRLTTAELEPGHRLWRDSRVPYRGEISRDGIRAGLVYGDGSKSNTWSMRKEGCRLSLFGEKDFQLLHLFESDYRVSTENVREGDISEFMENNNVPYRVVSGLPRKYKDNPDLSESHSYLMGWLAGYFASDGNIHPSGAPSITSHERWRLECVRSVCAILGITTGTILESEVEKLGKMYTEYTISINHAALGEDFFILSHHREYYNEAMERAENHPESKRWAVVSVESTDRVEEVFCVVEPVTERFALADGILTMNCPRRWYLAFSGSEYDETADALGVANMAHGVSVHDRLQKLFEEAGVVIENEREVKMIDPPIRAFIDSIVEVDGIQAVVEIKSTRDESFVHRKFSGNPMPYHLYQLLIYMYHENIPQGCLLYENKNDNTFLTIPIRLNDRTRAIVEECLEWLREVRANWEQDATWGEPESPEDPETPEHMKDDGFVSASYEHLPTRPFTKRSKECKSCPVFNECWNLREDGTTVIDPMEVVKL